MEKKENNEETVREIKKSKELKIWLIIISIVLLVSLSTNMALIIKMSKENGLDYNVSQYNNKFEKYFGEKVSGEQVIKLLDDVISNNISNDNKIGIDPNFTTKFGEKMTGQNNHDENYIENTIKTAIDKERDYIVKTTSVSIAYSDLGLIQRITIADANDVTKGDAMSINNEYEIYFGDKIPGIKVKELINKIKYYDEEQYKTEQNNYIRILFDLTSNYTKDNNRYYLLTGVGKVFFEEGNYLDEYIDVIIDDKFYYVDTKKYNADGTISEIVIADDTAKGKYINQYK